MISTIIAPVRPLQRWGDSSAKRRRTRIFFQQRRPITTTTTGTCCHQFAFCILAFAAFASVATAFVPFPTIRRRHRHPFSVVPTNGGNVAGNTCNYASNQWASPSSSPFFMFRPLQVASQTGAGSGGVGSDGVSSDQDEIHMEVQQQQKEDKDDDKDPTFLPSSSAKTTTEFLADLWELIAQGNSMVRGESRTVFFPNMESQLTPRYLNLVTAHLDTCKDVCDFFGILTTVQPYLKDGRVQGFTVKSFRAPDHDPDKLQFEYDPFWDDGDDWSYEGVDAEYEAEEREAAAAAAAVGGEMPLLSTLSTKPNYPDIVNKIPDDDEDILTVSKNWVAKICSDMGICPFTSGADQAGLPIGPVYYTIDRSTSMEDVYARYWKEVVRVERQAERDLSTTLLIIPEFCIDNVEIFESFSTTLTQPLSALGIEDAIQLVFFHPHWSFRDGGERGIGEGMAANYARRSPWPMINILRTNQVRAAQKGIPTGLVYKQNEKTLSGVGVEKLETMLRLRDWSDIADVKVNRREMEALRVAQDFQQTGVILKEDTSFLNDATPATNKVDENQVEQGNLVNVVGEALEKRLGSALGSEIVRLSGPQTSAAIMASDFLLAELERIIDSGSQHDLQEN